MRIVNVTDVSENRRYKYMKYNNVNYLLYAKEIIIEWK